MFGAASGPRTRCRGRACNRALRRSADRGSRRRAPSPSSQAHPLGRRELVAFARAGAFAQPLRRLARGGADCAQACARCAQKRRHDLCSGGAARGVDRANIKELASEDISTRGHPGACDSFGGLWRHCAAALQSASLGDGQRGARPGSQFDGGVRPPAARRTRSDQRLWFRFDQARAASASVGIAHGATHARALQGSRADPARRHLR